MSAPETQTTLSANPLADLVWLVESGADEAIQDVPVNRFVARPAQSTPAATAGPAANLPARAPASRPAIPRASAPTPSDTSKAPLGAYTNQIGAATEIAARCTTLAELKSALENFDGGALKRNATNTVFADGQPGARIMLIGEAPGRDEDRAGLPFVGRAGKLLDKMLAPIGLSRTENIYITNVLPWQPPGNRDFGLEEAAMCMPFLRRHIELKAPDMLVLLGRIAVKNVTGNTDGIMSLRGQWFDYYIGDRPIPALATLHPAYLLRRAIDKKLAWRDMQALESKARDLKLIP